jgi:hypothetical protein
MTRPIHEYATRIVWQGNLHFATIQVRAPEASS